jgi:putative membrane protein
LDASVSYCGPPVPPGDVWARWNFDPPVLVALLCLAAVFILLRYRETAPHDARARWFAAGLAALVIAFLSPLCALSATLFAARIAHHLLLIVVAAPLLAVAFAPQTAGRLPALPVVAAVLHAVVFWFWHSPAAYAAAMADTRLYWIMELTLLGTAFWFWSSLLAVRAYPPVFLTVLIGFSAQMGLLGAILVFAPSALFTPHFGPTALWGLTPLEDQQLAGLIMWVPGAFPYVVAAIVGLGLWVKSAEEGSADA